MEFKARLKYARVGALKAREMARLVAGKDVNTAFNILAFSNRKAGALIEKLLKSAVSLAEQKQVIDVDNLYVKSICVNQGPNLRRYRPRAKGVSAPYSRKQSHIEMVLDER